MQPKPLSVGAMQLDSYDESRRLRLADQTLPSIMLTRQRFYPRVVVIPTVRPCKLTLDFVLHRTVATVVPEHDFVVLVAIALHLPARLGADAALLLAHLAVEIVVVPDVDGHGVVEGTRTPHVRLHANARLCTGRHQDGRGENRLHVDGFERLFICFGCRLWSEAGILMELADMSYMSMLERPDLLYIIRLEVHGSSPPYRSLPLEDFVAWHVVGMIVGMIRQDASLAMNRAAEVTILSILLHNWICIQGQAVLGLHLALGFDLADYSFNLSSLFQSWLRRPENQPSGERPAV
jgi:hypothetical protein